MSNNLVQLPTPDQTYSRDQIELVKRTLAKGATDDELALFLGTAKRMGLDPFAQQIRAIRRKEYNAEHKRYEEKLSIEPGIDGFRLIAARTHEFEGRLGPFWCGTDGDWQDAWLKPEPPAAAKVGVLRKGFREPLWAVALYREYVATKADGKPTRMWNDRPAGQLAKCAEALALRVAFPHELGGVYTSDEMAQAGPSAAVQAGPAEIPGRPWDGGNPFDGDPFDDGKPARWAIENIVDDEDAKWLLQQPQVDDDYRHAVKKVVAEAGGHWVMFWRSAPASDWRAAMMTALEQSDPGSRATPGVAGDAAPASPGSDPKSPPTPVEKAHPTQAGPAGVEGANQSKPGDGPPTVATTPPGEADEPSPGRRPPGGHQRPTSGDAKGARRDTTVRGRQSKPVDSDGAAAGRDETEQAAYERRLAGES